jgi:hypothetical protein
MSDEPPPYLGVAAPYSGTNLQFSFFNFQFAIPPHPSFPAFLLALLCILFCSCHRSPSSETDNQTFDSWQAPESQPVQNSGRTLSGNYVLKSLDDDYTPKDRASRPAMVYTFDKEGGFKLEERSGVRLIKHVEGSYVIGTKGEMMLYVERVGDDQMAAAVAERYELDEQPDGSLKLHQGLAQGSGQGSATTLTLARQ